MGTCCCNKDKVTLPVQEVTEVKKFKGLLGKQKNQKVHIRFSKSQAMLDVKINKQTEQLQGALQIK